MSELNEYVVRAHELHHDGEVLLTGAILLLTARQAAPLLDIEAIARRATEGAAAEQVQNPSESGVGDMDGAIEVGDAAAISAGQAAGRPDARPAAGAMDEGAGAAGGERKGRN